MKKTQKDENRKYNGNFFIYFFLQIDFFSLFQLLLYILSKFVSIKMNIRYRNFNVVKGFEELSSLTVGLKNFLHIQHFLILNLYKVLLLIFGELFFEYLC